MFYVLICAPIFIHLNQRTKPMGLKKEPTFSWDMALKNAGGKEALAYELTNLFFELLPKHEDELCIAYKKKDFEALTKAAHKLHGALCYCGMPRLKSLTKKLEAAGRNPRKQSIPSIYEELLTEIQALYKFKPIFEKTHGNQKIQK